MFYLKYLQAELVRRWGNTLAIVSGLAIASTIIIVIISISQALSKTQEKVLNPLQNIGTDAMVTRSIDQGNNDNIDVTTIDEMRSENRITTDFSKLGNPGDKFNRDVFLPGTQLTFETNTTDKIDKNIVADYATGLLMTVTHQEGTIPDLSVDVKTGGESLEVNQQLDDSQRSGFRDSMEKAQQEVKDKGLDPRSEEGRLALDKAIKKYNPSFNFNITTPERTLRQQVCSFSTDVNSETLTIAGVDINKTDFGLITKKDIVDGKYLENDDQALISKSYADKKSKKIGDKIKFNDQELTIIGIVVPQLYSETADIYTTLSKMQTLSDKKDRINIVLAKAKNAGAVDEVSKSLEGIMSGAKVINSKDTAKEVTGSLASATNLTNRFIGLVSAIVVGAAFVIVSLLSIISLNKRTREIGTLKAIGWTNTKITRQIFLEKLVLGIVGALVGVVLAVGSIALLNRAGISLTASVSDSSNGFAQMFRRFGQNNQSSTANQIPFQATYSLSVIGIGALVAIIGSIIAGGLAAQKSLKLKPQEALRNLE